MPWDEESVKLAYELKRKWGRAALVEAQSAAWRKWDEMGWCSHKGRVSPSELGTLLPRYQAEALGVLKDELRARLAQGSIEGTMDLREHVLTIGPHGHIKAEVFAKVAIVEGTVTGTITASEKVDLRETGSVEGGERR